MAKFAIYSTYMNWDVNLTKHAAKQLNKLPEKAKLVTQLLVEDLKHQGPAPGKGWPNYGKLHTRQNEDKRHCHLTKGRPTYVACWQILDASKKTIEVYYVGTHEKAPY